MINPELCKFTIGDADKLAKYYDEMSEPEFTQIVMQWSQFQVSEGNYLESCHELRNAIVQVFQTALSEQKNRVGYALDLKVGLKIYEMLPPGKVLNNIYAEDDDFWRYISMKVMPDLTFIRFPNRKNDIETMKKIISGLSYDGGIKVEKGSNRIKKKRFYTATRRIWLKSLWWYIHLGWQGSTEETFNALKDNGSNMISQLIERARGGYRLNLYRSMMRAFSNASLRSDEIFGAAAKLNLANCYSFEPALSEGGEDTYSQMLFEEVIKKKIEEKNAGRKNKK